MAITSTVDFWKLALNTEREVKEYVNDELKKMKGFAIKISPTLTWKYLNSWDIEVPKKEWSKIVWYLVNDDPKAWIIEHWVKWRKYKYHEWPPTNDSTIIFEWVWNKTAERTANKFRPK